MKHTYFPPPITGRGERGGRGFFIIVFSLILLVACKSNQRPPADSETLEPSIPPREVSGLFSEDSAYAYCAKQCQFGPRVMNSTAHDNCGKWIAEKFRSFSLEVIEQKATLKGYDGTTLNATNIIAQYKPEQTNRILLCAHWDSRPWADNDPDESNHKTPIEAANDGASGVAVMLEIARQLQTDSLDFGVDFLCFDAEDWGLPQWEEEDYAGNHDETWALGAQYWAKNPHKPDYTANYGILLDMVGGTGARFCHEYFSKQAAPAILQKVWATAADLGYSSIFVQEDGGGVNDDHLPIIQHRRIPCIDIIPHHPDCEQSSFGATWHTVNDNMQNISKETLKAVGETLMQTLKNE